MSNSSHTETEIILSEEEEAVLKTLIYFDVFSYPMKPSELHQFVPLKMSPLNMVPCLNYIVNHGLVSQSSNFFSLSSDETLIERRTKGNVAAQKMLRSAETMSNIISRFPYVRCVCISGSLSKGYIDEDGDVDYFIVTKPGRLWIARTMLIAFKKVFLLNSKKYFCVNYFVDTDHLEIEDKNIFTATEVRTLLPMYDGDLHAKFLEANDWVKDFLPNYKAKENERVISKKFYPVKWLIELVLNTPLGEWIDNAFMKLTMNKWKKQFSHFDESYFEHALRSRKYVSKHHPQNFQKIVLKSIKEKEKELEESRGYKFNSGNG